MVVTSEPAIEYSQKYLDKNISGAVVAAHPIQFYGYYTLDFEEDDELSFVNLIAAYLKPEGYEVRTAIDGTSGLRAARAFKPDLVILDKMLPDMDGIELLSRLRRESEAYVILLTARTE